MATEKINRDFERHKIYTPRSLNIQYGQNGQNKKEKRGYDNYGCDRENKFKFKNSLVITPFYETEFKVSGGIKYIKNHDGCVFFTDDNIFALTNNIQKIPVLVKREINKQSVQKKLIIEEKYNYEEKYDIFKNIILYYEENRVDFQILFNKSESDPIKNIKDITTEFSLNLSIPGISGAEDIVTYKKYNEKQEYKSLLSGLSDSDSHDFSESLKSTEYMIIGRGKRGGEYMTVYPDKKLLTKYNGKSFSFTASNLSEPRKNYINLKIYLENYKIT